MTTDLTSRNRSARLQYLGLTLFILAILFLPSLLALRPHSGHLTEPAARHVMSDFTITQLDGHPWRLSDHRGQVVLVNFWATWCGPCLEELPSLSALARSNSPSTLSVLGVSLDSTGPQAVQDFASRRNLSYPVALPGNTWQLDQIPSGIPTTILLDRSGRVAKTYTGPIRQRDFQADINQLLKEPTASS